MLVGCSKDRMRFSQAMESKEVERETLKVSLKIEIHLGTYLKGNSIQSVATAKPPPSLEADVTRAIKRVKQGDCSIVFNLLRYGNNFLKYLSVIWKNRLAVPLYACRGGCIDTAQGIYDLWLGYVNFHLLDLAKLRPSHFRVSFITQTIRQWTLSRISMEILNIVDIACLAKVAVDLGRFGTIFFFGQSPTIFAQVGSFADTVMAQGTNGYKLIKPFLAGQTARRLSTRLSNPQECLAQNLDFLARLLDAAKVLIDLSPTGHPGKSLSPWLGMVAAACALGSLYVAFNTQKKG